MTKMLKRVLQDVLSEEENEQLISAFDQIGDIIIVRIPDSLVSKKTNYWKNVTRAGQYRKFNFLSIISSRRRLQNKKTRSNCRRR